MPEVVFPVRTIALGLRLRRTASVLAGSGPIVTLRGDGNHPASACVNQDAGAASVIPGSASVKMRRLFYVS